MGLYYTKIMPESFKILETCNRCGEEMNLKERKSTVHRGRWLHLYCWKQVIGAI